MNKEEQDSIRRAVHHHELTRAIHVAGPPYVGHPKWEISLTGAYPERMSLTWREMRVLCWVLAAVEKQNETNLVAKLANVDSDTARRLGY